MSATVRLLPEAYPHPLNRVTSVLPPSSDQVFLTPPENRTDPSGVWGAVP